MAWVGENFHIFWPAAMRGFRQSGRGAIVTDTTMQPEPGRGNPFGYFPQEVIETGDDDDLKRLVREYEPEQEFVVLLLKSHKRSSAYRIHLLPSEPPATPQPSE